MVDDLRGRFLGIVGYAEGLELQRAAWDGVVAGGDSHQLLILEHPPVFTVGKRGEQGLFVTPPEVLRKLGVEICHTDRGGLVTFHGPGQLVGYPILNLARLKLSLRDYVSRLLGALTEELDALGVPARVDMGSPGIYVEGRKIGAVGVRLSRGVTTHGFAINVTTDLSWFRHIVACGQHDVQATSILAETDTHYDVSTLAHGFGRRLAAKLGLGYVG